MNDLRFAFRQLRYAPAFTVTALATIAICLGANLAIFAVIDAILLRSLPFPESDRLVAIFNTYPKAGVERDGSSLTNYYERRGNIPSFSSLSIFRYGTEVVGETGSTQQEKVMRISPDFFTTLGTGPVIGRSFDEAETITPIENHGAAILTDAYWRQRLNSDPHVLGRDIRVNGAPRKIVGVLPRDFRFLSSEARIFLPLTSRLQQRTPQQRHSGGFSTHMIARLKPGVTVAVENTTAFVCGPPIMFRFVMRDLKEMGFQDRNIMSTLERYMKCGVGKCGHCCIGLAYVCADGPVFNYEQIKRLGEDI